MAVHQLVEQQAVRTPDAIAVRFGDAEVSYRDLDARAEALAQNLRHQGAGRDVLVGLLAERSLEMVVGILAIF
jgi:non-ribosomal peptide synthetase component F